MIIYYDVVLETDKMGPVYAFFKALHALSATMPTKKCVIIDS